MASTLAVRRFPAPASLAAAILIAVVSAPAQTNYAAEAAKNPGAASKPTPKMADGHPDLNGVWHHFFGIGTIEKVGDGFKVTKMTPALGAVVNVAPSNPAKVTAWSTPGRFSSSSDALRTTGSVRSRLAPGGKEIAAMK